MTTKPLRILVPTDFSDTANHAMRYASGLAKRIGATITAVYSDPFAPPIDYTATIGGWDESSFDALKAQATKELERDARTNIDPAVSYDAIVRVAPPLEGILAEARESAADLIVMGTHGRSGFRRLIIGSVTEAVMRMAALPVIAVPPGGDAKPEMKTIICPVVYTDQCRDALLFAASVAPPDAKILVIRSTPENDASDTADALFTLLTWVPESIAARCELKIFGSGHMAGQVEGFAQKVEADLIVAAEPVERSAADRLYGTFAARLIRHSDCHVLTINQPAAKRIARVEEQQRLTVAATQ